MQKNNSSKKSGIVTRVKALLVKQENPALDAAIKKANSAVAGNAPDKEALVKAAIKKIDKAAANGQMSKGNAARQKAALEKLLKEA